MLKPVKWSSFAEDDLSKLLDYLVEIWNSKVALEYIDTIDYCIRHIQTNPNQFPVINKKYKVRKCVISKHNSIYYKVSKERIEILRIYDTRQDGEAKIL
jgi:plasmid stabilization system protein ParE